METLFTKAVCKPKQTDIGVHFTGHLAARYSPQRVVRTDHHWAEQWATDLRCQTAVIGQTHVKPVTDFVRKTNLYRMFNHRRSRSGKKYVILRNWV